MVDILAITAHPDDLEICASGIMLKAKKLNKKIGLIICTRGENGGFAKQEEREDEALNSASAMGIDYFKHLNFPDAGLRFDDDLVNSLIPLVRECSPKIVMTLLSEDYHPDHVAVSKAVDAVIFTAGLKKYSSDDTTWHPKEVFYFSADYRTNRKIPDILVNIDDVMDKKIECCNAHKSQKITDFSIKNSEFLGRLLGCRYAEGLYLKQPLKLREVNCIFE